MIYFDRLFSLKKKYKEALDEDARKREKIEKDFADGWTTESYRKKALSEQDAALEYCRNTTLEATEAVKNEVYSMLDRWATLDPEKLPKEAAFLSETSPITMTEAEVQQFVDTNRYNATALRAAQEYAARKGIVLAFPPTAEQRKAAFTLFADNITGAIQTGLNSGFYTVEGADELLLEKITQNPAVADLEAVAASVAGEGAAV